MNLDALPKGVYEEWQDLLSRPDDQVVRVTVLTYSEDASEDMRQMEQRLIPLEDRAALDPSFGTYGAHPTLTNGSFTIRSRDSQNLQVIILLGFLLSGLVTIMLHSISESSSDVHKVSKGFIGLINKVSLSEGLCTYIYSTYTIVRPG